MEKATETADMPSPESHWTHPDPATQPARDAIIGIGRQVMEARARLGTGTTAADVAADLKARGESVSEEQVAQFWDRTN